MRQLCMSTFTISAKVVKVKTRGLGQLLIGRRQSEQITVADFKGGYRIGIQESTEPSAGWSAVDAMSYWRSFYAAVGTRGVLPPAGNR